MTNPNPKRITAPMWRMWTDGQPMIPGVRLGGIYADKECYHNTRSANKAKWPKAYCIKLKLDLAGPDDKAAGIDYTMADAEMRKRTGYLRRSALDPDDDRLAALREFYGTINGAVVYGLIKDTEDGPWRPSTADSSHLWHIHLSVFRAFVDVWEMLEPILSVLSGETFAEWTARREGDDVIGLKEGDRGPRVRALQLWMNELGADPRLKDDGIWGPATTAALRQVRKKATANAEFGPVSYVDFLRLTAQKYAGRDGVDGLPGLPGQPGPPGPVPTQVRITLTGELLGDVIGPE